MRRLWILALSLFVVSALLCSPADAKHRRNNRHSSTATYAGPSALPSQFAPSVRFLGWKERAFIRLYLAFHRDKPASNSQPAPKTWGELYNSPSGAVRTAYRVKAEHADLTPDERWKFLLGELKAEAYANNPHAPGAPEGLADAKMIVEGWGGLPESWLTDGKSHAGSFGLAGAPGY